ncbi:transposase [Streptomyces sp. NPDC000348]|uniref:transposase n=1 Tax=Streptomyces sp. NPDC000348 TaxID=3364538 RepID=UPI0036A235CA
MARHELTDAQWQGIESFLPANGRPGVQWADHRGAIDGVLFRARTGVPWPDPPERHGPWQTVYERRRRRPADGARRRIRSELQIEADAAAPDGSPARTAREESRRRGREWEVNIGSTSCRAHRHAAGARRRPPRDFPHKEAGRVRKPVATRHRGARGADRPAGSLRCPTTGHARRPGRPPRAGAATAPCP